MKAPPWTLWWQADGLRCQFSPSRAADNADFLCGVLGENWITRATIHPAANKHPFAARWLTRGSGAFLELNCLAENLRLLVGIPGIERVVETLKNAQEFEASRLVVHVAAMVERHQKGSVIRFPTSGHGTIPDIIVRDSTGAERPIEVKLMKSSDVEDEVGRFSGRLCNDVQEGVLQSVTPPFLVVVVLKCPHHLPARAEIVEAISSATASGTVPPLRVRREKFNLFFSTRASMVTSPEGVVYQDPSRTCYVLCPVSPKESLRIEGRVRHAAKQLEVSPGTGQAGLLCIGVGELQSPTRMARHLRRWFKAGKFASISDVMLLHVGTHLAPPLRCMIDHAGFVANPMRQAEATGTLGVKWIGMSRSISLLEPLGAIPAYHNAQARGCCVVGKTPGIRLPDIRHLVCEDLL